jgi:hypothetical protein
MGTTVTTGNDIHDDIMFVTIKLYNWPPEPALPHLGAYFSEILC